MKTKLTINEKLYDSKANKSQLVKKQEVIEQLGMIYKYLHLIYINK